MNRLPESIQSQLLDACDTITAAHQRSEALLLFIDHAMKSPHPGLTPRALGEALDGVITLLEPLRPTVQMLQGLVKQV